MENVMVDEKARLASRMQIFLLLAIMGEKGYSGVIDFTELHSCEARWLLKFFNYRRNKVSGTVYTDCECLPNLHWNLVKRLLP